MRSWDVAKERAKFVDFREYLEKIMGWKGD